MGGRAFGRCVGGRLGDWRLGRGLMWWMVVGRGVVAVVVVLVVGWWGEERRRAGCPFFVFGE